MTELDIKELSVLIVQRLRAGPDPKLTPERLVKILHLACAICLKSPVKPGKHASLGIGELIAQLRQSLAEAGMDLVLNAQSHRSHAHHKPPLQRS